LTGFSSEHHWKLRKAKAGANVLNDRETGLSMAVGEQAIITADAPEVITHAPREPVIRG
jgi:hypothetical protein